MILRFLKRDRREEINMIEKCLGKDLAKFFFGVNANTFSKNKEKYLAHLSEYYEWHMEGRSYVLDKELKP